jgi:6-phosphogluconolactonase (cycloisomerase 2 family)
MMSFDLNQSINIINDNGMRGIHFDSNDKTIYITSWNNQAIYIYHTNDETTFNKIHTISTSYSLRAITTSSGKIYTGTNDGRILVYNKTNYGSIQVMNNMCSSLVWSVEFDCNGNMIYSCESPPMLKIMGANGINSTLLLNNTFTKALETYIDSKNRLWIGGNPGIVVYN